MTGREIRTRSGHSFYTLDQHPVIRGTEHDPWLYFTPALCVGYPERDGIGDLTKWSWVQQHGTTVCLDPLVIESITTWSLPDA